MTTYPIPYTKEVHLTSDEVAAAIVKCARGRLPSAIHYTGDKMEYVVASMTVDKAGAHFVFRLQDKP